MIDGQYLEWTTNQVSLEKSLKWSADCTADTTNINIIYLAPAHQEQ